MVMNKHPFLRVILILFIMLSIDVIAALAASAARNHLDYEPLVVALFAIVTIVAADLVFLYLLMVKIKKAESNTFEDLVRKYYNGSNWSEAFHKAYEEWHDPFRRR